MEAVIVTLLMLALRLEGSERLSQSDGEQEALPLSHDAFYELSEDTSLFDVVTQRLVTNYKKKMPQWKHKTGILDGTINKSRRRRGRDGVPPLLGLVQQITVETWTHV